MVAEKQFQETKAFQIFDGSIRNLNQHLQLMDRTLCLSHKQLKGNACKTIATALGGNTTTHPQLNIPTKDLDISRTIATSRIKINEQAIIETYRHFSNYIKNLIEDFVHKDPMPLLRSVANNKENVVAFDQIIRCGNFDNIIVKMADMIFRRFENERSTPKLLDKIINYTKITVEEDLKKKALLYLEIRHLIIHNNSKADEDFKIKSESIITLKRDDKIPINFQLTHDAITVICALCKAIDNQLIEKDMVRKRTLVHANRNN